MGSAVALAAPFVPFAPFAFPLWILGVSVLTAAVLETLPLPVNDNLAAPLGTACVLYGLLHLV
jgi:dolichol kinase